MPEPRHHGRVLLLSLLLVGAARACDICAVYAAFGAHGERLGWSLSVAETFTHFGTLQNNGATVGNPAKQYLDSSVTQFVLGYRFNDLVGLQLNVPYVHRAYKRPAGAALKHGDETGLGDVTLLSQWKAYERATFGSTVMLTVMGGLKLPTGSSTRLQEELAEEDRGRQEAGAASGIHGHDLALGSGSVDGLLGATVYARRHHLFATAQIQYAIRSTGDIGYRFANHVVWSVSPGAYLALQDRQSWSVKLNLSGEAKGNDVFRSVKATDTGITSLFVGPELSGTMGNRFSFEAGCELPVIQDNSALQAVPDYRLHANLNWGF